MAAELAHTRTTTPAETHEKTKIIQPTSSQSTSTDNQIEPETSVIIWDMPLSVGKEVHKFNF